jgi:hypothetical protein
MSSRFGTIFKKISNLSINENNAYLKKSTTHPCLDAFNKLVRNVNSSNIDDYIFNIIEEAQHTNDYSMVIDMFVMMFHKRNCRGGEGEKLIMYRMLLTIYQNYPETIKKLIPLIPLYGYYKDYFEIWKLICEEKEKEEKFNYYVFYEPLINAIVDNIILQMNKDLSDKIGKISLLGKWLPRQGHKYDNSCFWYDKDFPERKIKGSLYIASRFFKQSPFNLKTGGQCVNNWVLMKYRLICTELTKKLNVPEVLMCANKYSEIEFEKVASKAMKNYIKAFLNEKVKGDANDMEETGNRYPDNEDRVNARKNLKSFISDGKLTKIKGSQLDPHEILHNLKKSKSNLEREILHAQWEQKKKDIVDQVKKMMIESGKDPNTFEGIGHCIPMIDVSGSMCGSHKSGIEPIDVAIALGIITSELASPPFRDLAMSFTEDPHLFTFLPGQTPYHKYSILVRDEVGYSTKFDKAIKLILDMCIRHKIPASDIPNLLVFTDGQFDEMNDHQDITNFNYNVKNLNVQKKSWKTCHEELLQLWAKAGYDRIPNIIYWNLRANTPGFQTSEDHPGVQLLQGYSPSLLKFILYGEEPGEKMIDVHIEDDLSDDDTPRIVKMRASKVSPLSTFRKAIDQIIYDPIREIVLELKEYM